MSLGPCLRSCDALAGWFPAYDAAYEGTLKSHDLQVLRGRVHRPDRSRRPPTGRARPVESAVAHTPARPRLRLAARRTLAGLGEVRRRYGWSGAERLSLLSRSAPAAGRAARR